MSSEPVTVERAQFVPRVQEELRVTARQIMERDATTLLIDVRTPDEFLGRSSRAKRAGHIPGAVNVPRGALVSPDGTMPAPEALRTTLAAAGVHLDGVHAITYCTRASQRVMGCWRWRSLVFRRLFMMARGKIGATTTRCPSSHMRAEADSCGV